MATIIDGKKVSKAVRSSLREQTAALRERGIEAGLAVVIVGADPASRIYVRSKHRMCKRVGIRSFQHELPENTQQTELEALIDRLNADPAVHGILVQLPLPKHLDEDAVLERISPMKDVDGFHPENVGLLTQGRPRFVPCTPAGIIRLLDAYDIPIEGRRAVVLGRSLIVGRPIASLLLARNATVTLCHSRTQDLPDRVSEADIVVVAIGRPEMVRGDWIKPGAAVFDVGINRLPDGSLAGDVAFDEAVARAGAITPVPGGVGPMTITSLLANTIHAAQIQRGDDSSNAPR